MMIKYLFLVCSLTSTIHATGQHVGSSEGTTLAFIVTDNQLYLATDSKVNHTYGQSTTACKISHVPGFVWSKTGFVDHDEGFSSERIIQTVLSKDSLNFHRKCQLINKQIKQAIKPFLPRFMKDKEEKGLNKTPLVLTTFISGFEKGKLLFEIREYSAYRQPSGYVTRDSLTASHLTPYQGAFIGLHGEKDSANKVVKYLQANNLLDKLGMFRPKVDGIPYFQMRTLGDFVFYLVYVQTKATPHNVGRPITVASFINNQFNWMSPKGVCW